MGLPINNRGRIVNYIAGLTGVVAGGQAIMNIPVNARYHRIILNCTSAAATPVAVTTNISSIKLIVNGIPVRDIDPANILRICQANGYFPLLGELPLLFSEPFLTSGNINEPNDVTSWDLAGQSSFQLQIGIQAGAGATPGITGVWEFDYQRNLRPDGTGKMVPFLQPVAHHQFSFPVVVGRQDITVLPFSYPIRRLWMYGSTLGQVTDFEIYQDGNKVHEATAVQSRQIYRQYGFNFISTPDVTKFRNATGPADLALSGLLEAANYFDACYLADPDGRWWKALKCGNGFTLRVNSAAAMTLNVIAETMPGAFAS